MKSVLFLLIILISGNAQAEMTILFGGDVLLDRGVRKAIEKEGVSALFLGIREQIDSSDFFVINLESPATKIINPQKKKYVFRAEPEYLDSLKKIGITHCSLANNHVGDQGGDGIKSTIENIESSGLSCFGTSNVADSICEPAILIKDDIRVAIFGDAIMRIARDTSSDFHVCNLNCDKLCESIINYKKNRPDDIVIVFLHWGIEYDTLSKKSQREIAAKIIKSGASAIIGAHPHVAQELEYIDGKPVYYSIGNLIFDKSAKTSEKNKLVQIKIKKTFALQVTDIPLVINNCKVKIKK